jgi:hypothetical protein
MKATVLAESSLYLILWAISTTVMSTDVREVDITLTLPVKKYPRYKEEVL